MNVTVTLIGQMVAFGILVWFVNRFLWGPLTNLMEERKKRVADGLAAAERGKHERELAEKRAKETLHEAKEKAAEIITQAQKRAGEIIEEAKEAAQAEGERLKVSANAEIQQEMNRAREDLRGQVVSIAVAGASKILKRELDEKANEALVKELVAQI
ncbi:F0F1 ATP synthase subunit B [Nitrosococcus oceani]|uniref:ATP synthase subunit b n=2 Tax=Nitrosococcus oceani TaxID=1229 RepID=ATPF_NITOC|nr:F0F1 ATP synthase subunit B [Nitrosococcus oceani]Q3J6M7.1 RecName: Full=ATP synthase subunit b; AltName: Full=ATP synthase F(0) sector subunit b; AltName: Full=ATPase subunit I; AltName: Full=F-type ATPase subunit b; Short=F-ATPase subunit b [Nitrosococcus oceani ATCC 19707]KFI18085.1 ATP synthase subunit B [Nitrosococcus oceani C-27]ABA59519.1 ATP synthase F0 subcomplex B subunit [Nitrosococcus oceani ATCC 19707]KFI21324.1 ATP synthase subunit B [Nitrosococcus oceani]GEM21354.1 ATP syntha